MNWIKDLWNGPEYFTLEKDKDYSLKELLDILETRHVSYGQGNLIVLHILKKLVDKYEK